MRLATTDWTDGLARPISSLYFLSLGVSDGEVWPYETMVSHHRQLNVSNAGLRSSDLLPSMATPHTGQCLMGCRGNWVMTQLQWNVFSRPETALADHKGPIALLRDSAVRHRAQSHSHCLAWPCLPISRTGSMPIQLARLSIGPSNRTGKHAEREQDQGEDEDRFGRHGIFLL
jgi:hypothetical protein